MIDYTQIQSRQKLLQNVFKLILRHVRHRVASWEMINMRSKCLVTWLVQMSKKLTSPWEKNKRWAFIGMTSTGAKVSHFVRTMQIHQRMVYCMVNWGVTENTLEMWGTDHIQGEGGWPLSVKARRWLQQMVAPHTIDWESVILSFYNGAMRMCLWALVTG